MKIPRARYQTLLVMAFCVQAATPVRGYELTEIWTLDAVFNMPESAVIDIDRDAIYISNVNTYAMDDNGFISRASLDGNTIALQWVTGLHSPTGMAIHDTTLYVADVDSLVSIDLDTASIVSRYLAPDSGPALNDVAISATGQVYVSGSASSTIYRLVDDELTVWRQDDVNLQLANGLLSDGNLLIHGGKFWQVFDQRTGRALTQQIHPGAGVQDFDGITSDGCGGYLFTLINDRRVFRVTFDNTTYPVSEIAYDGIDLNRYDTMLAVPRVGNSLSLLSINTNNCMSE